jgi:hypothetical protein
MFVDGTRDGADNRETVHEGGEPGEMFANVNAWNGSADGTELTSNIDRSIGLGIEHVEVRWATRQVDHDDGLMCEPSLVLRLGTQQLVQGTPTKSKPADPEKDATG